jgi:hypothetical protein
MNLNKRKVMVDFLKNSNQTMSLIYFLKWIQEVNLLLEECRE